MYEEWMTAACTSWGPLTIIPPCKEGWNMGLCVCRTEVENPKCWRNVKALEWFCQLSWNTVAVLMGESWNNCSSKRCSSVSSLPEHLAYVIRQQATRGARVPRAPWIFLLSSGRGVVTFLEWGEMTFSWCPTRESSFKVAGYTLKHRLWKDRHIVQM